MSAKGVLAFKGFDLDRNVLKRDLDEGPEEDLA